MLAALSELIEENVVARRVAGRAYLYRLVSNSFSTKLIAPLFRPESSPLEELGRLVRRKLGSRLVVCGVLYGSVARGEEGADSDIDLYLIVRREEDCERVEAMVSELNSLTSSLFGNRLSAMVKTVEESRRAYKARRGLEAQVESEGKLLLGVSLREALR